MASEADIKIETPAYDYRFPHTSSHTKRCWVNYNLYQRCAMDNGEDHPDCRKYYKTFRSICPDAWWENWDELLEENRYPVQFTALSDAGH
ncbi:cytochrome c oxidase polypeptide vib [Thecamonas trahens ATCC 50062]|uniref:Cytochrome c oxidase polypeptide vib n=1 Tax=Thecamonas trahens ATCC 50062 TaxID=461836 RepID=A0A0L0D393_THETB|nr:cytochrome c oxidase polypeptide vib [Thecamonas trahens ATCC 50062]KNC46779.1 cytochrome c oxidase polypeptide vib [Thecamonas trahens ATCC 50062]|eukprot:XP_013760056.1 cytochrome c oxidase polypeptide vib [Thecamonas trahens ATCC 50062]